MTVSTQLLPWHQGLEEKVEYWLESGRFPHGILLVGPAGVGKRIFAQWLSERLLGNTAQGAALLAAKTHPDYIAIQPDEGKKQISVDKIRDASRKASLTSQLGGKQLFEIFPAEAMNRNAANSLLKTLEEPTDNTILLLIAEQAASLLPTIKSRCQELAIPCPSQVDASAWLSHQGVAEADQALVLRHASGAPLLAHQLHQQGYNELASQWQLVLADIQQGAANVSEVAKQLLEHPFNLILNWLTWSTIDAIQDPEKIKRYSTVNMYRYLDALYATNRLQHGSLNEALMLESLLLPWASQFKLLQDLPQ